MKYELLLNDTKEITDENGNKVTLYRIRSTEKIGWRVQPNTKGGYIESYKNLEGDAWIEESSIVYGNAKVSGKAHICRNVKIYGNAIVKGSTYAYDCRIYDNAQVDNVHISGSDKIYGEPVRSGEVIICGNAQVSNADLWDGAKIDGNTVITEGKWSGWTAADVDKALKELNGEEYYYADHFSSNCLEDNIIEAFGCFCEEGKNDVYVGDSCAYINTSNSTEFYFVVEPILNDEGIQIGDRFIY